MESKQTIREIMSDYEFNLAGGMPEKQAREVLEAMLVDLLEYEKQLSYDNGVEVGQYGVLWDLERFGIDYVRKHYTAGQKA